MGRFVVISGCSSGGKSTLLAALHARGAAVVEEPGRAIVREETATGGDGLPWLNVERFAQLCIARAVAALDEASGIGGLAFFDRGVVDAVSALEHLGLPVPAGAYAAMARYDRRVFLTPPWPEIYRTDGERRHGLDEAVAEYERLLSDYPRFGFTTVVVPKLAPDARAEFVLAAL